MSRIITLDELKERFVNTHGNSYDYSKVEYKTMKTKVCIICPKHGEFWQTPNNHVKGQGCPQCALEKTRELQREKREKAKRTFIERVKKIHDNKYDYSKVEYIDAVTKICIICPIHGEFWQKPNTHLNGHGCPKCNKSFKMNTIEFIERAKKVHGDKYDYSKVEYKGNKTKVCIICSKHGEFWQRPNDHLSGHGCHECNCHNHTKKFSDFLTIANKVHDKKYKYNESTYINRQTRTKIICPEHGEFWQTPSMHLQGNGCPLCGGKCNISEQKVYNELLKEFPQEEIIYQYRDTNLLGLMSFDIYIPKHKIAIEHQGIQHFEPVRRFGGKKKLEAMQRRDKLKKEICNNNGVNLIYISLDRHASKYSTENMPLITSIEDLIKKIRCLILKNCG